MILLYDRDGGAAMTSEVRKTPPGSL